MNWDAWGRYFVELLLCLPAGLLCLAPVKERLRVRVDVVLLAAGGAITLFAAVGALVIVRTGWPENALLIPGMLLFFVLYRRLVRVQGLHAVFIFLVSAAVMAFARYLPTSCWPGWRFSIWKRRLHGAWPVCSLEQACWWSSCSGR